MEHVIVGPGKFGLGFAGELASRTGWRSTIIMRRPGTDPTKQQIHRALMVNRSYEISFFDKPDQQPVRIDGVHSVTVTDFSNPGEAAV